LFALAGTANDTLLWISVAIKLGYVWQGFIILATKQYLLLILIKK